MKLTTLIILLAAAIFGITYYIASLPTKDCNINKGRHYRHPAIKHL